VPRARTSWTSKVQLDVILLKAAGLVVLVIGITWLALGQLPGLVIVFAGRQLLLDPTMRGSPWADALIELIRRWRGS
jgi:hypothetical protein